MYHAHTRLCTRISTYFSLLLVYSYAASCIINVKCSLNTHDISLRGPVPMHGIYIYGFEWVSERASVCVWLFFCFYGLMTNLLEVVWLFEFWAEEERVSSFAFRFLFWIAIWAVFLLLFFFLWLLRKFVKWRTAIRAIMKSITFVIFHFIFLFFAFKYLCRTFIIHERKISFWKFIYFILFFALCLIRVAYHVNIYFIFCFCFFLFRNNVKCVSVRLSAVMAAVVTAKPAKKMNTNTWVFFV